MDISRDNSTCKDKLTKIKRKKNICMDISRDKLARLHSRIRKLGYEREIKRDGLNLFLEQYKTTSQRPTILKQKLIICNRVVCVGFAEKKMTQLISL